MLLVISHSWICELKSRFVLPLHIGTSVFQPEHKIQSDQGAPVISLQLVPKMLMPLVSLWVPKAFVISFKLETDPEILISKARKALNTYKHKVKTILTHFHNTLSDWLKLPKKYKEIQIMVLNYKNRIFFLKHFNLNNHTLAKPLFQFKTTTPMQKKLKLAYKNCGLIGFFSRLWLGTS